MKLPALNFLQLAYLEKWGLEYRLSRVSDYSRYEFSHYTDWFKQHNKYKLSGILELLSIKFEPSMIEKYFEVSEANKKFISFIFTAEFQPRTLDEFITLCQLAKIELYLK